MTNPANNSLFTVSTTIKPAAFGFLLGLTLIFTTSQIMQAQTFQVLHNFTGGADGNTPIGLAIDRAGNLYGTTGGPGNCVNGGVCGGVFKFAREGTGWIFSSLYHFRGGSDGSWPNATVTLAPDGTLYGTTTAGGGGACSYGGIPGCGTVYHLQPPNHICSSVSCPWDDTILYAFQPIPDVVNPYAEVTLDAAGNIFGAGTFGGGLYLYGGGIYEVTRLQNGWSYDLLFSFNGPDGARAYNPVLLDQAGNIYGTTSNGGENQHGVVFEMSSSGSGWTENILHDFGPPPDGAGPTGGLISDSAGNLYGVTAAGGAFGYGAIFELSPSGDGYTYSVLYDDFYSRTGAGGPDAPLVMDPAGNLYGTTSGTGRYSFGMIFELSPTGTGTLGASCDTAGGSSFRIALIVSADVAFRNAGFPVSISYRIMPTAKMSLRASAGCPLTCSGDM